MPIEDPIQLRLIINERLALLSDPQFEGKPRADPTQLAEMWRTVIENLAELRTTRSTFFDTYNYDWAFELGAYNSAYEAHLQWRLLNVISDISPDHPHLARCEHMLVRIVPTSCARTHIRNVDKYRVILITNGYLSAFKGFIRLWLRGRALGEAITKRPSTTYEESIEDYIAALDANHSAMSKSAMAYVGTLMQLSNNTLPFMDGESIFDETVLKREQFQLDFGVLCTAIDGFILFHEVAHLLNGDDQSSDRSLGCEMAADRSSVSLCIIDEARHGGPGTVHRGAPMFFCVELLRLLTEEILEIGSHAHDPASGRYPGIEELMVRSQFYPALVNSFLGSLQHSLLKEWQRAMSLVFDTVRWALLNGVGGLDCSLRDFVGRSEQR